MHRVESPLLRENVTNFGAGPAKLPEEVLENVQTDLLNFNNTGMSIVEISHRSADYMKVNKDAQDRLRELLSIPNNYKVLFLQGGGTGMFAAIPLNLISTSGTADYVVTGAWSAKAAKEAAKYGKINIVNPTSDKYTGIPDQSTWNVNPEASYLYYCANETIDGIEFHFIPESNDIPLVADMSSNILTKKLDVSKFGIIYAGAQKNFGPSGVTVLIIRDDLLGNALSICPSILNFTLYAEGNSIYNTPPTFQVYFIGLVFDWIKKKGGVDEMEKLARIKSTLIYDVIEKSKGFYSSPIELKSRSRMNIPFRIKNSNEEVESRFLAVTTQAGFRQLKGHRSVGGIRVSLYNAITVDETNALVDYMNMFYHLQK